MLAPDSAIQHMAEATGLGVAPIYAASETDFFVKVINVQLTFQRAPPEP
jgi:hypothetical protein